MVVVDDLHIVYRVYGAGGDRGTAATALLRILGRKTRGSIREVHAIRGISFVAYRGDAVGAAGGGRCGDDSTGRRDTRWRARPAPGLARRPRPGHRRSQG